MPLTFTGCGIRVEVAGELDMGRSRDEVRRRRRRGGVHFCFVCGSAVVRRPFAKLDGARARGGWRALRVDRRKL